MSKKSRKTLRKELRDCIFATLAKRGMNDKVHADRAEEYLSLWDIREDLREDIKANGTTQFDEKRGMTVENRSVSLMIQTSRQMTALYQLLGLVDMEKTESVDDDL